MAFNKAPSSFFGPGYTATPSSLSFGTVDDTAATTVGGTFVGSAATDTLTTASAHGLAVGDRVQVVAGTGALPTGLAAATDYFVKTVPTTLTLTLSAAIGGGVIDITADGGTAHLLKLVDGPLDDVSDAEANVTTGDWRKVVAGIADMISKKWARTPTGDRPSKLFVDKTYGVSGDRGSVVVTYTIRVTLSPQTAGDIADE